VLSHLTYNRFECRNVLIVCWRSIIGDSQVSDLCIGREGGALFELLPNQFQLHSTSNKLVPKVSLERSDHGYVTFLMAEMVLTSFKNDLKKGALR